ncbi:MAG TPA: L-threonylcarbamoyladenylate synthase [Acidobacteriota bacterium]|nr:L-threonylcarbamoyladenylate synthase [Acidobacteriota bacterium]
MQTSILKVGPAPMEDEAVGRAAELLRGGQVVAFPTETVYGLAADATSRSAVEKIYRAKQRPADNPLIVHIAEAEQLGELVEEGAERALSRARRLADSLWPGPLTLVVPAGPEIRRSCCRGLDTVAVRLPDHPVARALIARAGRPLAAPSANLSGRPSPTTAAHVAHDLGGRIPLILDAGPCRVGLESTVLDISGETVILLRPGAVSAPQIARVVGERVESEGQARRSPGTRHGHYRPLSPLYLIPSGLDDASLKEALSRRLQKAARARAVDSDEEETAPRFGYLGERSLLRFHAQALTLPDRPTLAERARHLYADLRALDALKPAFILADEASPGPSSAALRDRLSRAAKGSILE